ncbi:hypothetical protein JCM10207_001122 [Rhodosporidiobolus poonsookiae]
MHALRTQSRTATAAFLRPTPASLRLASPRLAFASTHRTYATAQDAQAELHAKQIKLAEKAGRMKQNVGAITQVPVFANHIPPAEGRVLPEGAGLGDRFGYIKHDTLHWGHSLFTRMRWRSLLGAKWFDQFKDRSLVAYREMNHALATGNFDKLRTFASHSVLDAIKTQRTRKLQGLRMSWKLHKVVEQTIVCAREQEIFKKDEKVGQVAVRFVTEQSLEIRDLQGRLVGNGSHERPERVTEYCIFQRDMWRPDDDWKCVKKGAKETDTLANPGAQP